MPLSNYPLIKRLMLERHEKKLRRAIEAGCDVPSMRKTIEAVRHGRLKLLKGRREIAEPIRSEEATPKVLRELENIERETLRWKNMSAEEIVTIYRKCHP